MIESTSEFYKRIDWNDPALQSVNFKGYEYTHIQASKCNIGKTSFSYKNYYKIESRLFDIPKEGIYFFDEKTLKNIQALFEQVTV